MLSILPSQAHRAEALSRLTLVEDSVQPVRAQKRHEFNGHRALVIDDDPDIPPLVRAALAPFEIHAESVRNGWDAFASMETGLYHLIVLDIGLEDLNGFDVLRALKRTGRHRRVPVIILTSDDTNEALARSFGYGADDLVTKPFDPHELGMRAFRLVNPFHVP